MAETLVPPMPSKSKHIRENGYLTEPWVKFFQLLRTRLLELVSPVEQILEIDGGFANSVYLATQDADGGDANGS